MITPSAERRSFQLGKFLLYDSRALEHEYISVNYDLGPPVVLGLFRGQRSDEFGIEHTFVPLDRRIDVLDHPVRDK